MRFLPGAQSDRDRFDYLPPALMISRLLDYLAGRTARVVDKPTAPALLAQGAALHKTGEHAGARRLFEQALDLDPLNAEAHHLLGVTLSHLEDAEGAIQHLEHAIRIKPDFVQAYDDLGLLLFLLGRHADAVVTFRKAVSVATDKAQAYLHLGLVLKDTGNRDEALVHLREAHRLAPGHANALRSLVVALNESACYDEALAVAKRALDSDAGWAEAQRCCGYAYQNLHDLERALFHYDEALRLGVDDADFHRDRGLVLQDLRRLPEAMESYERALALRTQFPGAVVQRALVRLLTADYARGWADYEARFATEGWPARSGRVPRWDGGPLSGRTILVHGEQGLGDQIMFASCLPEVIRAARHCVIACPPKLVRLFKRSFPQSTVYGAANEQELPPPAGTPKVDVEVPAGSLPLHFRRSAGDFPRHDGYLKADPQHVAAWRERLMPLGDGLKIGVSWRGGVHKTRGPLRSMDLEQWLPLFNVPGTRFVSLQYTPGAAAEVARLETRHGVTITHWQEAIDDYDETAALVCALDLVISVCTAVIHLGGALGREVWVIVPFSAEWRYGAYGDSMPWYPSVRLFRQPALGQWKPVISAVTDELGRRAAAAGELR